jgi:hypothetical protein
VVVVNPACGTAWRRQGMYRDLNLVLIIGIVIRLGLYFRRVCSVNRLGIDRRDGRRNLAGGAY